MRDARSGRRRAGDRRHQRRSWETEGHDRESIGARPATQDELVRHVAAVNDKTVRDRERGVACLAMPWINDVAAVLVASFGGMEMADTLVDVLTGVTDPGGRLPDHLSGPARGHARVAELSPGRRQAALRRGPVHGLPRLRGGERRAPLFPFGHGLSYGEVEWGEPEVSTTEVTPPADPSPCGYRCAT